MSGPLEGILVVTVEQAVAAPLATQRMADAGARVIKIERPGGDFARGYDRAVHGDSSYFAWTNHGKESVVLDIGEPGDAAFLHRLISSADVFVQNLAPGALVRRGFGSAALREVSPRLITLDVSGYGEAPEVADKKAYDLLVQAESGIVGVSGPPGELGRVGVSICDIGTGITAYAAILEALVARATTGEGRALAVSLFDVAAEWMTVPLVQHELGDGGPERVGLRHPSIAPYGAFETADGALTLIAVQNEPEWRRLTGDVLGRSELADDERFIDNPARVANRHALEVDLGETIGHLDAATLRGRLDAAAIAWGAVSSLDDLVAHPALRRRSVVASSGEPAALPAHPVRPAPPDSSSVPMLGAHTDAIRAEFG
ncbi:MAG: CaiB/BaiF CoA-transferase family protein [Actinomycetota bacterium]